MKNDIIIINAFPNNEEKLMLLVEQLRYLKKLEKPILLVSGCVVPEFIENKVDYLLVNTDNEIISKDFCLFLKDNGIHEFAFDYFETDGFRADFYWDNVNSTITKNIKLGFQLAETLGYKTAFYTEDDNIWKQGSFGYIKELFNQINSGDYKIGGVRGKQDGIFEDMIFTTFFCADVNYFNEKFTIPVHSSEWFDINNVLKFSLYKTFENVFFELLKSDLHYFYNSETQFNALFDGTSMDRTNLAWGINDRRHSEKNLIKTFFNVLPSNSGEKILILENASFYLKDGVKPYTIHIHLNGGFHSTIMLDSYGFFFLPLPNEVHTVNLKINEFGSHLIDANNDAIKKNGFFHFKQQLKPVDETINYVAGGQLGDFIQSLYVAQQQFNQTGKKANLYITDDLSYGGDIFTRPLDNLYFELAPIILNQPYINKFGILNKDIGDFVNLNVWRSPQNLLVENFPWIKLFDKVYLSEFKDLAYQPWLTYNGKNNLFYDKVVIHRTYYRIAENTINWEQLIRDNDCIFVGFEDIQYEKFPYKHLLPFHKMQTLGDFCEILNTCKFYVGNQTGPLSIAHAMDAPRLAELCGPDAFHYLGEEKYYPKLNWISDPHKKSHLVDIYNHIKYEPL